MHNFSSLSQLLGDLQQFLVSKSASFCLEMRQKRHNGEKSKQRVFDKKKKKNYPQWKSIRTVVVIFLGERRTLTQWRKE